MGGIADWSRRVPSPNCSGLLLKSEDFSDAVQHGYGGDGRLAGGVEAFFGGVVEGL